MAEEPRSVAPTTTKEEDLTTASQRKINVIWEVTQSAIGIIVTLAVIYCSVQKIVAPELVNAFFLVIGFYYSRTNHAAIGGVGNKPNPVYEGR